MPTTWDDEEQHVSRGVIGDLEFARFQELIQEETGIFLAPVKRALLVGRLARRLRDLGLSTYGEYYDLVQHDEDERITMLDRITTNETHFFREPRHFEFLMEEILPKWRSEAETGKRPPRIRVWSTACSTGEEPYTLAMILRRAFPEPLGWSIEILATDLSTRALARAREGVWPIQKAEEIPECERKSFMLRGVGPHEGTMKACRQIREMIRFDRVNLTEKIDPSLGKFDLIFCRNVIIYFDTPTKNCVVGGLLRHLDPTGYLFLGHSENLTGSGLPVQSVIPTVYVHAPLPAARPVR